MVRTVGVEADPKKHIVVADIPDVDSTTDLPIPDTGDEPEIDDYEGLLGLGFVQHVFVPVFHLNIVYLGSCFEGEIF